MRKGVDDIFRRLAAAEKAFAGSEFLAPVVRGRGVAVKIAGVRCTLSVHPVEYEGWGVFRALSQSSAALAREATASERQKYLRLLPMVALHVCFVDGGVVRAIPANLSDKRFDFSGAVGIQLCGGIGLFDAAAARFDGSQFWFEDVDRRADPAAAAYLRRELARMADPKELQRAGLKRGARIAYAMEYSRRASAILADERYRADRRLTLALAHAGAILCDFAEDAGGYRVTYTVDGHRHASLIRKDDLTVQSAGICLSGEDRKFDLSSLVGVLREGAAGGGFVRY